MKTEGKGSMGNKLGRRRQVVEEKYTRPQGLYQHKDVDQKKLRKLILDSKLAPCYPGDDECAYDHEECPICFLYYPSLNRSRCCMKGICTECFLQMKAPNSARPTQCPFCKTSNYAVEYRGVRTKEEKGLEQIEEQRVIEAKIRIRQKELHDEEERMQRRQDVSSSSTITEQEEAEYSSVAVPSFRSAVDNDEIVSSQDACTNSAMRHPLRPRNRDDEFDLDLEDIMVMEAIWLSIQEKGRQRNPTYADTLSNQYITEEQCHSPSRALRAEPSSSSSSSPSGGLACAIAALAERQQLSGEPSMSNDVGNTSSFNTINGYNSFAGRVQEHVASPTETPIPREEGEWGLDHGSAVAEAGTSYASSDVTEEAQTQDEIEGGFQPSVAGPIVPESFEEQMMLAMAVSLAEARARTNAQGVAWL